MTFGLFSFVVTHYAFALFLLLAAYAFGSRLTGGVAFANRLEQFVFASITGLDRKSTRLNSSH